MTALTRSGIRIRRRAVLATLGVLVASLLMAPGALGSTLSTSFAGVGGGDGLRLVANAGETNVIGVAQAGSTFTVTDAAGLTLGDSGCSQDSATRASCTGSFNSVAVVAGDGSDQVTLSISNLASGAGGPAFVVVNGGDGDDLIDASAVTVPGQPGTQVFAGYAGNDTVKAGQALASLDQFTFSGVPGEAILPIDQTISAPAAGNDHLVGGPGADNINATTGADVVEAGGGDDNIGTIGATPDLRPQDDNAVDQISCGDGSDLTSIGTGDQVAVDCEFVIQMVTCPPGGAECEPFAVVTAAGGASAAVASATAAKKRGKVTVVGKARKSKPLKSGQTGGVIVRMKQGKVRKVLGKRSQTRATFLTDLKKVRGKKTVGHVRKKTRFKLKR
jgi:hypothetical protein